MRITAAILKEYSDLDTKEKAIACRKEELRQAIIEHGSCAMGDHEADVTEAERQTAKPRDEIIAEIGAKACSRIMKTVRYTKVSVRKR